MQPSNLVLVDVRSTDEYASGHVDGAINLPLDRFVAEVEQILPDKNADIVLYCASGARSDMACRWLQQQGYTQASNGFSVANVSQQTGRGIRRL